MKEDKEEECLEDAAKDYHCLDCPFAQVDRFFFFVIAWRLLPIMGKKEQDELDGAKDDREDGGNDDSNHQSLASKVAKGDGTLPCSDVTRTDCDHKEGVVERI